MLSIDEAIARERQQAKEQRNHIGTWDDEYSKKCEVYAEEHEQIAEWLEELKFLRQWKSDIMDEFCKYDVSSFEELVTNTRNKAIDDFVKAIVDRGLSSNDDKYCITRYDNYLKAIKEIAEQLKAGDIK